MSAAAAAPQTEASTAGETRRLQSAPPVLKSRMLPRVAQLVDLPFSERFERPGRWAAARDSMGLKGRLGPPNTETKAVLITLSPVTNIFYT